MWIRLGYITGLDYRCDICGCLFQSLAKLISHGRFHGIIQFEPAFASGEVYGLISETDPRCHPDQACLPTWRGMQSNCEKPECRVDRRKRRM
jgi:hypothetical protein